MYMKNVHYIHIIIIIIIISGSTVLLRNLAASHLGFVILL
jgi:hypothetical protein